METNPPRNSRSGTHRDAGHDHFYCASLAQHFIAGWPPISNEPHTEQSDTSSDLYHSRLKIRLQQRY